MKRRLMQAAFWIVFGIPFAALLAVLWVLALFPGTLIAYVISREAENAWVICAPLILLADGLNDWAAS